MILRGIAYKVLLFVKDNCRGISIFEREIAALKFSRRKALIEDPRLEKNKVVH